METSISMANSPPSRAILLVSTLPPRPSSTPVTRSTMPIRSGPVRVNTKFLGMERLPFDIVSGRYLIAGRSHDATSVHFLGTMKALVQRVDETTGRGGRGP